LRNPATSSVKSLFWQAATQRPQPVQRDVSTTGVLVKALGGNMLLPFSTDRAGPR
jgi:hypothetical protein